MNQILTHAHSGLRWVALGLIVFAIINAIKGKTSGEYTAKDKKINLFAMISLHTQLLIGLVLMNFSGKVNYAEGWMKLQLHRFFGMEHILMMVVAIVLITIGRKKAENASAPIVKHKTIVTWYLIALIVILAAIPWPFMRPILGGSWI
jgi:uncharacterized membrane protein